MEHRDITRHVLVRLGGHDLMVAVALTIVISLVIGAADWRVLAVILLLRGAVWIIHATALLAPVRAWQSLEPAATTDRQLLEADAVLDQFLPKFLRAYLAGLVGSVALAVLLGAFDVFAPVDGGRAEQMVVAMLLPLLAIGERISNAPLITQALVDPRTRVASMLVARRIQPNKPPRALANDVLLAVLGSTLGLCSMLIAVAGLVRVKDVRERAALEQVHRAELTALGLHHGELVELESGLEVVATDALPPELSSSDEAGVRHAIVPAQDRVLAAAPVGDGRWVLAQARPDEQLLLLLGFWLGFMVVIGPPLGMAARALARSLVDPLTTLDESTRKMIDDGQIHSLGRIVTLRNDEVGRLAGNFNRLLDQLAELADAASTVAQGNLTVELQHPGELQDAFRGMLARLREVVEQIRLTAFELASTAAEIQAATREQEFGAERQAANMQDVSSTVDSLAATAAEITSSAAIVLANASQAASTTQDMTAQISEFDGQTRGIAELLQLIREIADRSDLLALNGSLEAVRAGDAGRGFALVAAEMRRLAERVNDAVASVRERVDDIARATERTIESTKRSYALVQSTAEAAQAISEITARQSQETRHASTVVRDAANGVTASAAATSQTRASAEALREQADELERLVRRFGG